MRLLHCSLFILPAFLILLVGSNAALAQGGYEEKVDKAHRIQIEIGQVPPDFTATDLGGNEFTLSEYVGVKPVVLDFWATWCGPCRMEMPLVSQFTETYGDRVAVYSITSEEAESRDAIDTFIADNNLQMRFVHDPSREIMTSYGVTGIPYLVVIGVDGTVVATHLGYTETVVEELVSELGLEPAATEE
jgi:cytochrome c biogenesis protein CcmG/thiol:disulfide interchange protein DsbE